jgi:hypothetical protein
MDVKVAAGDEVWLGDKTFVVTEMAVDSLPLVRAYLLGVARAGGLVTYGELVRDLQLRYSPQGVGVLLDVLSVDCIAREEPLLAALVVRGSTLESGDFTPEEAEAARELVYRRWLSKRLEDGGQELLGPVRGTCPQRGSGDVTRIIWGMPAGPDAHVTARLPEWVAFGGCVMQPFNARCDQCGQKWSADDVGKAVFTTLEDLYAYSSTTSEEDLADWISGHYELDVAIMEQGVSDGLATKSRSSTSASFRL